jgi:hypothetical protein
MLLQVWVHPLVSFAPSAEYISASNLPVGRNLRAPFVGFLSPSRPQCGESTNSELPSSRLRSILSVSHALDGLLLATPSELVSSQCHVRDSPFRGFLRYSADLTHRQAFALLTFPLRFPRSEASFTAPENEAGSPKPYSEYRPVDIDRGITSAAASIPS